MSKPTLAFFGATGGCVAAAITLALQAGYDCSALVRTPSKLTELMLLRSVRQETLDEHLTMHQGNIKDAEAVEKALVNKDGSCRDMIIYGIGGVLKFSKFLKPDLDDPEICQSGMAAVLSALSNLHSSASKYTPPLLVAVSTTGISEKRDIPLAMIPLYHWMLAVPHQDKKVMEEKITATEQGLLQGWIIIQPALLTNGPRKGASVIKAGYAGRKKTGTSRWGDRDGVVVDYTISREDVGGFIFEECIERGGDEWVGRRVTLAE